MRKSVLERIVDERVGQTLVGSASIAIDRVAEEVAREAVADDTFRRMIRELVRVRSQELLDDLLRNGTRAQASAASAKRRRARQ